MNWSVRLAPYRGRVRAGDDEIEDVLSKENGCHSA